MNGRVGIQDRGEYKKGGGGETGRMREGRGNIK